jgi:NTE family protein
VANNDLDKMKQVWNDITFEKVMDHKYKLKNKSVETFFVGPLNQGFSINSLKKFIDDNIDEKKIRESNIKMGIVITEKGLKYRPYSIDEIPDGRLSDYVIASCSAWPFLKKVKIDNKVCYDGFYTDNLPVKLAFEMGAEKVIAIEILRDFKKKIVGDNVFYIKPSSNLGFFLNFDSRAIKEMINLGYCDVMDNKEQIKLFMND